MFINNGLSGLLASQRALQTISNNVANAHVDGYVRQQVNFATNPAQTFGSYSIGTGVRVSGIERIYDQFLGDDLKNATMSQSRAQSYNELAVRLDGLLGNPDLNISTSVQRFFDQLEAVNRDPTSIVNREQLLAEGEALANRFRQIDSQVARLSDELDGRLQQSVTAINDLAAGLAEINGRIAASGSSAPNDLLDEQERMLNELAQHIDFTQLRQDNGAVNVMIGSGQPLVLGVQSLRVALTPNEYDASKLELAYDSGTGAGLQAISSRVAGGAVAGMMAFRNETLATVNRELGQMALGLSETFNAQHGLGVDMNGEVGADFFTTAAPSSSPSSRNTGTASVALNYGDVSAVAARDYELLFDGSNWQLTDAATGAPVTMSGSGSAADPFVADGLEIVIGGAAAVGDRFMLQPVARVAAGFATQIRDSSKIAVASMLTAATSLQNGGNGSISPVQVADPADPGLLQSVNIVFDDATTYRVYDGGGTDLTGPLAYTSGADVNFNGWSLQVSGTPQAGDRFDVRATGAGSGDNSNGLVLAGISQAGYFAGGSVSVESLGASMLTSIGSAAARSGQELLIQTSLRGQAELDLQNVAGVNLEEEAANLLRYQEAYLAASKVIGVANDLFQTLLATVGR